MVCDLRLDVSGLTVLRDFLEITVVHSGKVVLPVIDVEAVVVDGVAKINHIFEYINMKLSLCQH